MNDPNLVRRHISKHGLSSLEAIGIAIKDYPDRVLLNYRQIGEHRFDPIVRRCRGLILRKPYYEPLCVPLMRFYNAGEDPETDSFPWQRAIIEEKLDGSLMNLYWDGHGWTASTRGTAFAEGNMHGTSKAFSNEFSEVINRTPDWVEYLRHFRGGITLVFELTGPNNRVVRRYNKSSLSLLSVVNNHDGTEWDHSSVSDLAESIGFRRPTVYRSVGDLESARGVAASMPDDLDEGVIAKVRRGDGWWRLKIKNPAYLELARIRGNGQINPIKAIRMVLDTSAIDYLAEFPEDEGQFLLPKNFINTLKEQVDKFSQHVEWDTPDQKAFALRVKNHPCAAYFFSKRSGRVDSVEQWLSESTDNGLRRLMDVYETQAAKCYIMGEVMK